MKVVLWLNTAAAEILARKCNVYTNVYAMTNPPMFTAMNSSVSHANSTTAFNTVMAHFC